jgi:hypothetical protein
MKIQHIFVEKNTYNFQFLYSSLINWIFKKVNLVKSLKNHLLTLRK